MPKTPVQYLTVAEDFAGQRIDNFLMTHLKGVPKTHVYRILRKGEVRVNKKRVAPSYRIKFNDQVRLPPLDLAERKAKTSIGKDFADFLRERILYEDDQILVVNKPAGIAVHGGSGVKLGLIEAFRLMFPSLKNLELAHRLDVETSGCLMIAKKRSVLRELHALQREGQIRKIYHTLTKGHWKEEAMTVDLPLQKNILQSGERMVRVHAEGKPSTTIFSHLQTYTYATLLEVLLKTGRTHQIRVHAAHLGHPVACDEKYGDREFNKIIRKLGLSRIFLHAYSLDFVLPKTQERIKITAPLDKDLVECLKALE
jgi:23S rRNA pseudouridine955/2504/2580 synthase